MITKFPYFPYFIQGGFIMLATAFIDNAKVMSKGQITIPKDIRQILGLSCGDRVSFIVDSSRNVRLVNSATYAMQVLQKDMANLAAKADLNSEDDVMQLISNMRLEGNEL